MDEETFISKPNVLQIVWGSIASVGWYIIGVAFILVYSWPYILTKYSNWKVKKDEREYDKKYHKDPDIAHERMTKIDLARHRMQEKYNRDLEIAKQKELEVKDKKRLEALEKSAELESGHKLGGKENADQSTSGLKSKSRLVQDDYNPLMGDSGKRYRPPKRTCCGSSGGGCG